MLLNSGSRRHNSGNSLPGTCREDGLRQGHELRSLLSGIRRFRARHRFAFLPYVRSYDHFRLLNRPRALALDNRPRFRCSYRMAEAQVFSVAVDELADAIIHESLEHEPGNLVVIRWRLSRRAVGRRHVEEQLDNRFGSRYHRVHPSQAAYLIQRYDQLIKHRRREGRLLFIGDVGPAFVASDDQFTEGVGPLTLLLDLCVEPFVGLSTLLGEPVQPCALGCSSSSDSVVTDLEQYAKRGKASSHQG